MLKWSSLLLEVTCINFARATNTDMWQAKVNRLGKTVVSLLKTQTSSGRLFQDHAPGKPFECFDLIG